MGRLNSPPDYLCGCYQLGDGIKLNGNQFLLRKGLHPYNAQPAVHLQFQHVSVVYRYGHVSRATGSHWEKEREELCSPPWRMWISGTVLSSLRQRTCEEKGFLKVLSEILSSCTASRLLSASAPCVSCWRSRVFLMSFCQNRVLKTAVSRAWRCPGLVVRCPG